MYAGWEAVRKLQKLTLTSVGTQALRNSLITMDEGNFLGHNVYLVKEKNVHVILLCFQLICFHNMLYYGTELLRVEGCSQATIIFKKLSEKCEEDNHLFLSFLAVNRSQGKKESTDMKDIIEKLSFLRDRKIHK